MGQKRVGRLVMGVGAPGRGAQFCSEVARSKRFELPILRVKMRFLQHQKFHNIRFAKIMCSSKAKMSALSKVEMSVSAPFWEFGGCHFDGHGGDEQARAEPS
jgi:hypothetical protein